MKTDSPDLYWFTKEVVQMYRCSLHSDMDNVYAPGVISEELKIKTHYESLDIAGTNRIHYLCFSLPDELPGKETDELLKKRIWEHAGIN